MIDEGVQFILAIVLGIAVLCGFGTYNNAIDNKAMLDMVKAGADPQKAACAVHGSTEINKRVCHVIAAKYGN